MPTKPASDLPGDAVIEAPAPPPPAAALSEDDALAHAERVNYQQAMADHRPINETHEE